VAVAALAGGLFRDDRFLVSPPGPPYPPRRTGPRSEGPPTPGGNARRTRSDVLLGLRPQDREDRGTDARARGRTIGGPDRGHPEDGGPRTPELARPPGSAPEGDRTATQIPQAVQ